MPELEHFWDVLNLFACAGDSLLELTSFWGFFDGAARRLAQLGRSCFAGKL